MEQIAENVYIERSYPRIVLGAIKLKQGMLFIDSPFRAIDAHLWQSQVNHLGSGLEKLLVIMDAHIDRIISIHEMEISSLGHQNTIGFLRSRSTATISQDLEIGSDWVQNELPISNRCYKPNITFSEKVLIHWDEKPVTISHKPGANESGLWVIDDVHKIIFIGDSVVINQPPFFAYADINSWIEELTWLKSDRFKGFTIVSSRNGIISPESVVQMISFLETTKNFLAEFRHQDSSLVEINKVVRQLMDEIDFGLEFKDRYQNRLIWGLEQYIKRHDSKIESQCKGMDV